MKRKFFAFAAAIFMLATGTSACGGKSNVSGTMIKASGGSYVLDNGAIQVSVDKSSGEIVTIKNLLTGVVNKTSGAGAWPFMIQVGSDRYNSSVSSKHHNKVSSAKVVAYDDRETLELTYSNLITDNKAALSTGIKAVSRISIGEGQEYIKLSVALDMSKAAYPVKMISFCNGGGLSSGAADGQERMTAPTWGGGVFWNSPFDNNYFNGAAAVFPYPGKDTSSLEAGWIDIHGSDSGVGVGLISKSEMMSEFNVDRKSVV